MMITQAYCLTMARYNAWQNRQLKTAFAGLSRAAMTEERGAFFGSILGTANHLLWADQLWMARLTGKPRPKGKNPVGTDLTASREEWEIARFQMDGELLMWAEKVKSVDLAGDLTWYSGIEGADVSRPVALCVTHMFNHQTHHRGQIHAMLTAAGAEAPVSDLIFMPEAGPWL